MSEYKFTPDGNFGVGNDTFIPYRIEGPDLIERVEITTRIRVDDKYVETDWAFTREIGDHYMTVTHGYDLLDVRVGKDSSLESCAFEWLREYYKEEK